MQKEIAVIDLKSFYASCECACRGLDPFKSALAVVDPYRGPNTVVMSASPYLKTRYKVPNVCRKRDLPKDPKIIYAVPRMELYLNISSRVVEVFLNYIAKEDLHIYSVDESFLDLTPYLSLYGCDAITLVKRIQKDIYSKFHLTATAGIAPNPFLAKVALDVEGKKRPPYVARWTKEDIQKKLWKIEPIDKLWGINHGIRTHLERIGIRNVYQLAKADEKLLLKEFGIMGYQLKDLANGIDESVISSKYIPENPSLSYGQTLYRPYEHEEGLLILQENVDELCFRLRKKGLETSSISLFVASPQGSLHTSRRLAIHTQDNKYLFNELKYLYISKPKDEIYAISISFGRLRRKSDFADLSFEVDPLEEAKNERLYMAIDAVNNLYGQNTLLRASSRLSHSMIYERHNMIGGHKK